MDPRSEVILILSLLIGLGFFAQRYSRIVANVFGLKGETLLGIELILIGALLGPQGINLITRDALEGVSPVFALGLGWIGMSVMIEMDLKQFRRMPVELGLYSLIASVITFAVSYVLLRLVLAQLPVVSKFDWALMLAVLTIPVAPEVLAARARALGQRSRELSRLVTLGILDDVFSILFYLLIFPLLTSRITGVSYFKNLIYSLIIGFVTALILNLLTIPSRKRSELLLILLGIVFLASGLSAMLGISPFLTCSICGLAVANSSIKRLRIAEVLQKAERPVFFLFLVLAGGLIELQSLNEDDMLLFTSLVAFGFVCFRWFSKYAGYWTAARLGAPEAARHELPVLALSGIFIAMLVDVRLVVHSPEGNELLYTGMLAFVLSMIFSHLALRFRIGRAG